MPRRRPTKKGSFDGHFDELVKHFPDERASPSGDCALPGQDRDDQHINDRLLAQGAEGSAEPLLEPVMGVELVVKARDLEIAG
jgi:hypothetical protein